MDSFDIDRARAETRGCEHVVHFNNAGASLMPTPVAKSLHDYLETEERIGGYETVEAKADQLDNFYRAGARLLNCDTDEVAFVENATRAWDMAFYAFEFKPGDRVLTTVSEYGSNVIAYLQQAEKQGVEIVFVDDDAAGQIDLHALEAAIDERTRLISISHIPTGGGLVNPAAAVGEIAQRHNIPYILDACQSVGQVPLDVNELKCTVLSGTGRKYLRGPRGTGLLYVQRDWIEQLQPPLLDQHAADLTSANTYVIRDDARRFENWEQNFAGKVGLGVAMDYALDWGLETTWPRVQRLAASLRDRLSALPGISITDQGETRCGIVTFTVDGLRAPGIKQALKAQSINVTVSDGSGNRVSYDRRGLSETVRASVHYFNTEDEIATFVAAIKTLA
ncbi:MAG: aminotransferase class V-fold PLP-dependent enzyme [Pseudomonadota bacterium]